MICKCPGGSKTIRQRDERHPGDLHTGIRGQLKGASKSRMGKDRTAVPLWVLGGIRGVWESAEENWSILKELHWGLVLGDLRTVELLSRIT